MRPASRCAQQSGHPDTDHRQVGPVQTATATAACRKGGASSNRHTDTPRQPGRSEIKPSSRGHVRLSRRAKSVALSCSRCRPTIEGAQAIKRYHPAAGAAVVLATAFRRDRRCR